MSITRSRLASLIASRTATSICGAKEAVLSNPTDIVVASVDAEVADYLADVTKLEKEEFTADAVKMFPQAQDADEAVSLRRRLAKRSSEANALATWIIAEQAGRDRSDCEQYRKASTMRASPQLVLNDLRDLCRQAGLAVIPCETNATGKPIKAKATPAPVLALMKLADALKVQEQAGQAQAGQAA